MAGVSFKKTFSYAGFEMQPKRYENPKIALLNIELELKKEKENAEVRIDNVEEYQVRRGIVGGNGWDWWLVAEVLLCRCSRRLLTRLVVSAESG